MRNFMRIVLWAVSALCCGAASATAAGAADISLSALAPAPGSSVDRSLPSVGFSLESGKHIELPASAIHVTLDGADVSPLLIVNGNRVTYVPAAPLARGTHRVDVAIDEPAGADARYGWSFDVTAESPAHTAQPQLPPPENEDDGLYNAPPLVFTPAVQGTSFPAGAPIAFYVSGPPNGYGYVAFPGLPATFPLVPYGPGRYYAVVPIPAWYVNPHPFITCHFFHDGVGSAIVPLNRRIEIKGPAHPDLHMPATVTAQAPGGVHAGPIVNALGGIVD